MDSTSLNQTTTVETVFKTLPGASHIFIQHKTICVGCPLTRFCTLGEVAAIYELDLRLFMNELEQAFTT